MKKGKKRKSIKPTRSPSRKSAIKNERLYKVLLSIYKFSKLEDFLLIKTKDFLNLCEAIHIGWDLDEQLFKGTSLFEKNDKKHTNASPYWCKFPLEHKGLFFGHLIFISSHKITSTQKNFFKRVTYFIASSLHFVKNKEKIENVKREWEVTFDSLSQSLCITDKNFQILRTNQSLRQLLKMSKKQMNGKNIFQVFSFPIKEPPKDAGEYSWISHNPDQEKSLSLKFSIKTISIRNEKVLFKLVKVKDITEEFKMEQIIAQKAKEKDLGLIKVSIAHELNNPIAGMKTLIEIIGKNLHSEAGSIREILADMHLAIERCQYIISKLLSVSHQNFKKLKKSRDLNS